MDHLFVGAVAEHSGNLFRFQTHDALHLSNGVVNQSARKFPAVNGGQRDNVAGGKSSLQLEDARCQQA